MFDKLNGYLYREVATMMIMVIISVSIIDYLCGKLRSRFIWRFRTAGSETRCIPDREKNTVSIELTDRQHWMAVLAKTSARRLEKEWLRIEQKPEYDFLRQPETGAVMVQGRVGGTGEGFNMGEMTVTRCTVQSSEGPTGSAYVMGRNHRHAELAAVFDALFAGRAPTRGINGGGDRTPFR